MKKILFVINSLTIGGSEKSLVSLLNLIDFSKYTVDLLMLKTGEEFDKYIPKEVNVLDIPEYYKYLHNRNKVKFSVKKLRYIACRYRDSLDLRINKIRKKKVNNQQIFYKNQKNILNKLEKRYDVAIAYAQGFPTYFVADKVNASKKLAWINCDYKNTLYDKEMDKSFYKKFNKIIAVSEACKKSILEVNKEYEGKIKIIKDIVNPTIIKDMAKEEIKELSENELKILTVARLVIHHKGYDIAIKCARLLLDNNIKFKWYVVGDGVDRDKIEKIIKENNMENNFILLGSKNNPYPYMSKCDIYVQPSRYEGFGLTVIEAKILKKLIVCSNFNTVNELIEDNIDGVIAGMTELELYKGIMKVLNNKKLSERILLNLNSNNEYNSTNEIEKIYDEILYD